MASVGHVALGMAAGRVWAGRRADAARKAMLFFSVLSLLPDLDTIGMAAGVAYGAPCGHRGATHSLAAAVLLGVAAALVLRLGSARSKRADPNENAPARAMPITLLLGIAVAASHGVLDAMTDGGRGVAFFWPLSTRRMFLAWRPIPIAPIGTDLLSVEGLHVVLWEALVFSPLLVFALWPRRRTSRRYSPPLWPSLLR
jgi:inner membrane protein